MSESAFIITEAPAFLLMMEAEHSRLAGCFLTDRVFT
jgi:hypothetical protein